MIIVAGAVVILLCNCVVTFDLVVFFSFFN